jgi:hypothetical protein
MPAALPTGGRTSPWSTFQEVRIVKNVECIDAKLGVEFVLEKLEVLRQCEILPYRLLLALVGEKKNN